MTTRRRFLGTLPLLPALLGSGRGHAAPGAGNRRIALVIGNNAYPGSPLLNPVNDATAMGKLLGAAGFVVDLITDANRVTLDAALRRFVASAAQAQTKEAILYYAGHGAQLDWRNYLLPVDAQVGNADELRARCADLNQLLGQLPPGEEKTYLFLLDACRDDPFGGRYQPGHKGLSQFDAPPGTLIAFATGPGRVAADGDGMHGLYTEKLLKELAVPGVPVEDALKRVRLNVRLASEGTQIPWESTSLESSVVLFPAPRSAPAESRADAELDEELDAWNRIKSSTRAEDWIAYLRQYPDGKFAEIAQVRLDQLLPPKRGASRGSPSAAGAAPQGQNPYSAGSFPLGRHYTVGDRATYRISHGRMERQRPHERPFVVSRVDHEAGRVEVNRGNFVWDLMGNPIKAGRRRSYDVPAQYFPAELRLGKKWTALFHSIDDEDERSEISLRLSIRAREKITVPAGEFDCFRIEAQGWNTTKGVEIKLALWVAPGINFFLRRESMRRAAGRIAHTERWELASLQQSHRGI